MAGPEADTSASATGEPVSHYTRALPRPSAKASKGSAPVLRPEALADTGKCPRGWQDGVAITARVGSERGRRYPASRGELDGQDELSAYGATEQQRDGFLCRLQRDDAVEGRGHLTGVDEACEYREVGGVLPAHERPEALAHER